MSGEIDTLITEIKTAFSDMRYPRDIGYPSDVADLIGKQWQELSVGDVFSNYNFFLFSDEGFKYLLPGYMEIMLKNPDKWSESFVINGLLRHLCQEYEWPPRDLCKLFDKKQRRVIIKFLQIFDTALLPNKHIEERIMKLNRNQRAWARKELEKQRQKSLDLLEKARLYWEECQ